MNLRQLESFRAIMATGSTLGAARLLNVSQPAISRMLAHTESGLGMELFERRKGRLIPTDEARLLHREIEPLFLAVEAAKTRIRDIREGRTGSIRVVSTPSMANSVAAQALKHLCDRSAGVRVTLDVRRWENLVTQLEANTADVGFVLTVSDWPGIETQRLFSGQMVCILPSDHPLTARDTIGPEDLEGQPFVRLTRSSPLGELVTRGLGPISGALRTVIETRYCNTACSLVQNGIGIALVDEFVVSTQSFPGLAVRPFAPAIPVDAYAVLSSNRSPSRITLQLIREVRKLLSGNVNSPPLPPLTQRQA